MIRPGFDAVTPSTLGRAEQSGAAAGVSLVCLKSWPRERLPAVPRARGRSVLCPVPREPSWSPAGGGETSATDVQTQFLFRTAPSHKNCVWTIRSGDSHTGARGIFQGESGWSLEKKDTRALSRLPPPPAPASRPRRAAAPAPTSFERRRGVSHPGFHLMAPRGV